MRQDDWNALNMLLQKYMREGRPIPVKLSHALNEIQKPMDRVDSTNMHIQVQEMVRNG